MLKALLACTGGAFGGFCLSWALIICCEFGYRTANGNLNCHSLDRRCYITARPAFAKFMLPLGVTESVAIGVGLTVLGGTRKPKKDSPHAPQS